MCWISKNMVRSAKASKDIEVYKVLRHENGYYITPYMHTDVDAGSLAKAIIKYYTNYGYQTIEEGIHSFKNLKDAIDECEAWGYSEHIVVKCTIPEGTKYYLNEDNMMVSEALQYPPKFIDLCVGWDI